ncbi:unnamed protein product (macronuclear) [Paramecium tetraurelia]|uniref:Uncharacterized protein n=1 Tax=Paramecium tetraurelia TaxID=5888 RepID=A0DM63_PARTE|nr:uncharacterized protein GSPATT00018348001 [Paramecium tetraurelia]CAK84130.1 unnamed protein product [Paramecium tetraurelia]|eukprot:XP_001451527.1 hypothetical protein (macronuclear) [Paramecium tetraurelia strain d4-2]
MGVCQYRFYGSKSHRQNHSKLLMSKWQKRILKPKLIYSSITYSLYELHLKGQVHFLQQYFCFKNKKSIKGETLAKCQAVLKTQIFIKVILLINNSQSQYGIVQHNVTGVVNLARNIQKPAEPDQDFDQLVADMKKSRFKYKKDKKIFLWKLIIYQRQRILLQLGGNLHEK